MRVCHCLIASAFGSPPLREMSRRFVCSWTRQRTFKSDFKRVSTSRQKLRQSADRICNGSVQLTTVPRCRFATRTKVVLVGWSLWVESAASSGIPSSVESGWRSTMFLGCLENQIFIPSTIYSSPITYLNIPSTLFLLIIERAPFLIYNL